MCNLNNKAGGLAAIFLLVLIGFLVLFGYSLPVKAKATVITKLFLPLIYTNWPPTPTSPTINPINNSDQDNLYNITWTPGEYNDTFTLAEATLADFSVTSVVYQGSALSWTPTSGKMPGTYYYRISGSGKYGTSSWSGVQSVTIYPLFVGLKVRWDGNGYIRGSNYYDVGTHTTWVFNTLIDADTIRLDGADWYAPNPKNWTSSSWFSYYSPITGVYKSSNTTDDPSWKWGAPNRLSYNSQFQSDTTILIDGQKFAVTGPVDGFTSFGKPIKYWQFVNQEKFVYYDSGGDWTQYVHPGDITLRYDAGSSRLILYDNVLRRFYYKGSITSDTVQYISILSSATSIPGSPSFISYPNILGILSQKKVDTELQWSNLGYAR